MDDLIKAFKSCDVDRVRELLDADPSLIDATHTNNGYDKYNLLLLFLKHYCVRMPHRVRDPSPSEYKSVTMIELLLKRGIDINYIEPLDLYNALTFFIYKDDCDMYDENAAIVGSLIDHGIDINHGDTGHDDALYMLLEKIAETDFQGRAAFGTIYSGTGWCYQQLDNAQLCAKMIVNAMFDAEKKKWKRKLERELAEQKEQLLKEIYAPNSSADSELSGIGYQVAKERFEQRT